MNLKINDYLHYPYGHAIYSSNSLSFQRVNTKIILHFYLVPPQFDIYVNHKLSQHNPYRPLDVMALDCIKE